jgi:hypothetical protein
MPFNLPKSTGWTIGGRYFTTTDEQGEHTLNIEGHLEAPELLNP